MCVKTDGTTMILSFQQKLLLTDSRVNFGVVLGRFGALWAHLLHFWPICCRFISSPISRSILGAVGAVGVAGGPAAVVRRMGGGIPFRYPVMGSWRKFHTPSGRLKPVAADL